LAPLTFEEAICAILATGTMPAEPKRKSRKAKRSKSKGKK
jgi:hypothetical protein